MSYAYTEAGRMAGPLHGKTRLCGAGFLFVQFPLQ